MDTEVIEAHGHSDWSTSNSTGRPVAIVYPRTTEDVSKIAQICTQYNTPMGKNKPKLFSALINAIVLILVPSAVWRRILR